MLFRIVKVNSNNEIVLILNTPINEQEVWDDRFNITQDWEAGINDYSVSRVKDYLKRLYYNEEKDLFSINDDAKAKLVKFNACIGARKESETSKDNSVECSKMVNNQIISLLTVADYMNASTDNNCRKTIDKTCQNYNYLADSGSWWLLTPTIDNNYQVYGVSYGQIWAYDAAKMLKNRPVIHLGPTAKYDGGKGTEKDPYTFR